MNRKQSLKVLKGGINSLLLDSKDELETQIQNFKKEKFQKLMRL